MRTRVWDVTISCPRPKPRVSVRQQAWHLEPGRVQRTVEVFFARGTALTLTARTVRLRTQVYGEQVGFGLDGKERRLATLLQCLYFETGDPNGGSLPSPVRFEIVERTEQTPPSDGDQMT
jgi:hypothetical protein